VPKTKEKKTKFGHDKAIHPHSPLVPQLPTSNEASKLASHQYDMRAGSCSSTFWSCPRASSSSHKNLSLVKSKHQSSPQCLHTGLSQDCRTFFFLTSKIAIFNTNLCLSRVCRDLLCFCFRFFIQHELGF
jgi:hypothetical protein